MREGERGTEVLEEGERDIEGERGNQGIEEGE
jgi:hypothetical protein